MNEKNTLRVEKRSSLDVTFSEKNTGPLMDDFYQVARQNGFDDKNALALGKCAFVFFESMAGSLKQKGEIFRRMGGSFKTERGRNFAEGIANLYSC